ncbi:MAG TPA: DUF1648 domain-containing protein [Aridibacter sp.]|nr:DUF1648 domain-containing protein [Aridibacter sp.]
MKPLTFNLYALSAALAVLHGVYFYPVMPDVMAVHFGSAGVPDGFSSQETFFAVAFGMIALNVTVFGFGPWIVQRKRIRRLSLPNSGRWLAPGNIDEFYFFFREKMAWFGIVNLVFGSIVSQLVFNANSVPEPRLDGFSFFVLLTAYFVFVIIWLFAFFRKLSADRG